MRIQKQNKKISNVFNYAIGMYHSKQGRYKGPNNIILKENKTIYFPIPKVACTSVLYICAEVIGIKSSKSVHEIYFPSVSGIHHCINQYNDYFKFAFVRNPWDRLVSCYTNKVLTNKNTNNDQYSNGVQRFLAEYNRFESGMKFPEFVDAILDIPDRDLEKHLRPQYTFIPNNESGLLVDFIGRFESLSEDINYVLKKIDRENITLPHLMVSERSQYQSYYDTSTREKVKKKYEKDIDLFGYSF